MKAAVMGYGTIGSGVVEILMENRDQVAKAAGEEIDVKYILDLRDFPESPVADRIVHDFKQIEEDEEIRGLLILLNTVGGDVEAGLAIAEMIASISKPTVSLVLGGSHSIGVPIAVSSDYSFIVKTGTMVIHPVRMSGTVIGAPQTYEYFRQMQDRIISFVAEHSRAGAARLEQMMMNTSMLTKDLGTILVGEEAVKEGLIDAVGGISHAVRKLRKLCRQGKKV